MDLLLALALIITPLSSPIARGEVPDPTPKEVEVVNLSHRVAAAPAPPPLVYTLGTFGWPWDALAQCESGGRWHISHGSFRGGLQFLTSTWLWMGGGEFAPEAHLATPAQQIAVAKRLVAHERAQGRGGWNPWPACADRLGLPR